jgi:peptidoglycan/LPS O-acetylase OafA/YrhL
MKGVRLNNIDALRGLCAMLVVFQHLVPSMAALGAGSWHTHPHFFLDIGRVGVAAFFLISGYVIPFSVSHGEKPVAKFWISRCFRLWPAYWVAIILAILVGASRIPLTFKTVALNFTMMQKFVGVQDILGVFWTLQIELMFYFLITGMIVAGIVSKRMYFRRIFYFMVLASLALGAARGHFHRDLPIAPAMGLSLMFLAGYIRHCKLENLPFPRLETLVYVITLVPICLVSYGSSVVADDDPFRPMLAYLVGLGLFLVFRALSDAPPFFVFLGAISYSIYLLHEVVIKVLQTAVGEHRHVLILCLAPIAVILVSWASYRLVEKPCQQAGRGVIGRVIPQPAAVAVAHES